MTAAARKAARGREWTADEIAEVKAKAVDQMQALVADLLPNGRREGGEWRAGSVDGEPGRSLAVKLTRPDAGLWIDHSIDEKRGDFVELAMACRRISFPAALDWICARLGIDKPAHDDRDHARQHDRHQRRPTPDPVPAERPDDWIGATYNDPHQNYLDAIWAAEHGFDAGDPETLKKIAEAFDDFEAALPVPGSIAEAYVRTRIPGLADDFVVNHDALRFEPQAWHSYDKRRYPALICKAIRARTAQFCGAQRIYLQPDGSNRLAGKYGRLSFGRLVNSIVKLSPQRADDGEIVVTEGVIKGLAAIDCGVPGVVCATLGTSGLSGFPHLAGVTRLSIVPDRDEKGRKAADALARRYQWRGTPVRIVAPPSGKDLDAYLRGDE